MPSSAKTHPPLGSELARVQLRNALAMYLHQLDPPAPNGYHRWAQAGLAAAARPAQTLLVGDPIVLSVSAHPTRAPTPPRSV
jgi:hypothetical protein